MQKDFGCPRSITALINQDPSVFQLTMETSRIDPTVGFS